MDSWITRALPGAVAYASSLLGDRSLGEDVAQECICRLLAHGARYDLPRDGRKLLFRSITHACINLRSRHRDAVSLDEQGRSDDGPWEMPDELAATPLELVIAEELRTMIHEGLQSLSLRQRSALELASLGYRGDEIGEMLNMPADHARVLLHRARRAMAAFLNSRHSERVVP